MLGYFKPKFGPNIDKPSNWVNILNDIFSPKCGFVHILPKMVLKQPSILQKNTVARAYEYDESYKYIGLYFAVVVVQLSLN